MKRLFFLLLIIAAFFTTPVKATAVSAPEVPSDVAQWMPEDTSDFGSGAIIVLRKIFPAAHAELSSAIQISLTIFACVLLVSILRSSGETRSPAELAGAVCIAVALLQNSETMISLAIQTIQEISEYSKLFLPVIASMTAAQGAVTSSTALCIGTSIFTAFLSNVLRQVMIPCVYLFLAASIAHCALGEATLKGIKEQMKKISAWFLKTLLAIFLSYMSITGVLTGATDKAALKVTKAAISAAVPVIGSSLADASEALLLGTAIAKNAVGIYGVFAFLAIFLAPFVRIGTHYLILKATAALCSIPGPKRLSDLVEDFCSALGLLLGMTGSLCVLSIIGAVCFLKGTS